MPMPICLSLYADAYPYIYMLNIYLMHILLFLCNDASLYADALIFLYT